MISDLALTRKEVGLLSPANRGRIKGIIQAGKNLNKLVSVAPAYINLDPTWRCNFTCSGCVDGRVVSRQGQYHVDQAVDLDWNVCQDLIIYAKFHGVYGFVVQGGEPLLYNKIDDFLLACRASEIILRLVTNGTQIISHGESLVSTFSGTASYLRVSINWDSAHYDQHTGSKNSLRQVLTGIEFLAQRGIRVVVSSVVFGRKAEEYGLPVNIDQMGDIVSLVRSSGASRLYLRPRKVPSTQAMIPLSEAELANLESFDEDKGLEVCLPDFSQFRQADLPQNKDYPFCPTSFFRIVVGPDAGIYACTSHRGVPAARLAQIQPGQTFTDVWHSVERVRKQLQFSPVQHCPDNTCDKHRFNTLVIDAREEFERSGSSTLLDNLCLSINSPAVLRF